MLLSFCVLFQLQRRENKAGSKKTYAFLKNKNTVSRDFGISAILRRAAGSVSPCASRGPVR